jgi:hypothetical protein
VRLTAPPGTCAADAIYVRSAARFNNSLPAATIRLQPMDGILLKRDQPLVPAPVFRHTERRGASLQLIAANLTTGLTNELLKTADLRATNWQVTSTFQAQSSETNLFEVLPPDQPAAFYRLRIQ